MYKQYLRTGQTKIGLGVFTNVKIPANTPIMEFKANLITSQELKDPENSIQIGNNLYIGPSGGISDHLNHSCNPNCILHIIANRAFLYSLYVIMPDSEITFDYSTSSTDTLEQWKMSCLCDQPNCRKIISGLAYVDDKTKAEYKTKGMIPMFMYDPIFSKVK